MYTIKLNKRLYTKLGTQFTNVSKKTEQAYDKKNYNLVLKKDNLTEIEKDIDKIWLIVKINHTKVINFIKRLNQETFNFDLTQAFNMMRSFEGKSLTPNEWLWIKEFSSLFNVPKLYFLISQKQNTYAEKNNLKKRVDEEELKRRLRNIIKMLGRKEVAQRTKTEYSVLKKDCYTGEILKDYRLYHILRMYSNEFGSDYGNVLYSFFYDLRQ